MIDAPLAAVADRALASSGRARVLLATAGTAHLSHACPRGDRMIDRRLHATGTDHRGRQLEFLAVLDPPLIRARAASGAGAWRTPYQNATLRINDLVARAGIALAMDVADCCGVCICRVRYVPPRRTPIRNSPFADRKYAHVFRSLSNGMGAPAPQRHYAETDRAREAEPERVRRTANRSTA